MRENPRVRMWDSETQEFVENPAISGYDVSFTGVVINSKKNRQEQHLHALRTYNTGELAGCEYDVTNDSRLMVIWNGEALKPMWIDEDWDKSIDSPLSNFDNLETGFNALEHPGKLKYTIPTGILNDHPLLKQAIERYETSEKMRKHVEECAERHRAAFFSCLEAAYPPYSPRCQTCVPKDEHLVIISESVTCSFVTKDIKDYKRAHVNGNKNSLVVYTEQEGELKGYGLQFESKTECDRQLRRIEKAVKMVAKNNH